MDDIPPSSSVTPIAIGAVIDLDNREVPKILSILKHLTKITITKALAKTPAIIPDKIPKILFLIL